MIDWTLLEGALAEAGYPFRVHAEKSPAGLYRARFLSKSQGPSPWSPWCQLEELAVASIIESMIDATHLLYTESMAALMPEVAEA